MFKILHAEFLAPGIKRFVIEAPRIARKQKPGQFVILRLYEQGERIPLTIEHVRSRARHDPHRGPVDRQDHPPAEFSEDRRSHPRRRRAAGQTFGDREVRHRGGDGRRRGHGDGLSDGGGAETAGNRVISIVGARNKELVILEREMREVSDALMITTDDGSYADKGFVTDKLRQLIENGHAHRPGAGDRPDPDDAGGGGDDAARNISAPSSA